MQYRLKSAVPQGLPYDKTKPGTPTVYGVNVIITTEIVGQTYEGFINMDIGFCPILQTESIDQALVKIEAYSLQYVATKYPNT